MSKKSKSADQESTEVLDKGISQESGMDYTNTSKVSLKEYSKTAPFAFDAKNYRLLLIGLAINILGFVLMIGGASEDPNQFNGDELFSNTRITIAPILIVLGYVVVFYSIMKKNKEN
jgi:hypothetical protein